MIKLLLVALFVVVTSADEGEKCFDGSAYIKHDVRQKPLSSTKDTITLKFRSSDASGLLLYAKSRGKYEDHVLIELVNGKLRIRYQLGQNTTLKEDIIGDGLGDDILSTVTVKRTKKRLEVAAFGGQSDKRILSIPGADDRLDLNGYIYVGGYEKRDFPSYHKVNFKGCMMKAIFNDINLLDGQKNNKEDVFKGIPSRSMNFNTKTFIKIAIQKKEVLDAGQILQQFAGSFEFRTVLVKGIIFQASSVTLKFQQAQLVLESGSIDLLSLPFPNGYASDGRWFKVKYVLKNNLMQLTLNDREAKIKPTHSPQYGTEIIFGYDSKDPDPRFIGCIRNLVLQSNPIDYPAIIDPYHRQNKIAIYDHLTEGCKASDKCLPNPCFHEAQCFYYATGIKCECVKKYKAPLCQFSQYKTSCTAIRKDGSVNSKKGPYFIDPDDSGPEPPIKVLCDFNINKLGQTEVETIDADQSIDPKGHSERFSYKKEIKYQLPISSVKAIVDRSEICEQRVKYECRHANLFNQPHGSPMSRWLSANGYLQYYWGGAAPGSYKCACAYTNGGCGGAFCNCDSAKADHTVYSDEGVLNVTRDLPLREVHFGGLISTSVAKYNIEKIICYGIDALGVVTFVAPDGWLRIPAWNSPIGGDISFYIKTVFAKGDLIDHRNSEESHIFQVKIYNSTVIAVVFSFDSAVRTKYLAKMASGLGTLSDNKWHKIHIIRTLRMISVKIDEHPTKLLGTKEEKDYLALTGDHRSRLDIDLPMFVGSFWRYPTYKTGYIGCMKGFTINGVLYDLENAVDHLAHEPETLVLKGCGNACRYNKCPYGKCIEKYTSYECDCTDTPFYGKYCTKEYGTRLLDSPVRTPEINVTTGPSKAEKIILAFSTGPESTCSGTLFEMLNKDESQYFKLVLVSRSTLDFQFLLDKTSVKSMKISAAHVDFCDTSRHIVYIERNATSWFKYKVDGRPLIEKEYKGLLGYDFDKPFYFYVGNTKKQDDGSQFIGCISGVKFHLFSEFEDMKTVQPILDGIRTNDTDYLIKQAVCGPAINTPRPMTTRIVPGPTTPTDYPSTEHLRDVGIHEAEDSNWAILIVVALLMMLLLVALVVLTIWFVMQHKNDYQILEKEDGTVVGTATVRGGNASLASVPAAGTSRIAASTSRVAAAPSQASQGNLSRAKSKSTDVFV